jgi:hypothetical protein
MNRAGEEIPKGVHMAAIIEEDLGKLRAWSSGNLVLSERTETTHPKVESANERPKTRASQVLREAVVRGVPAGVLNPDPDTEERRHWAFDRESHQHGGIFPKVLEGDRDNLLIHERPGGIEHLESVAALDRRSKVLFDRQEQTGASGGDQEVHPTHRLRLMAFNRGFEIHDAALAADIPLEGTVPRLLRRELVRPQTEDECRKRDDTGDHAHQTASVECPHQDPPGAYRHYFTRSVKMRELMLGERGRGGKSVQGLPV